MKTLTEKNSVWNKIFTKFVKLNKGSMSKIFKFVSSNLKNHQTKEAQIINLSFFDFRIAKTKVRVFLQKNL